MRHEVLVMVFFFWLALQIPLALLVVRFIRMGSTGPTTCGASRVNRAKRYPNRAVMAHGRL